MGFFLFFSIIICINIYDWWKLRHGLLAGRPALAAALLAFMLVMALMPLMMRWAFRGHGNAPRALEIIAWLWLAWGFWLATAFLITDLWDFALISWRLLKYRGGSDPAMGATILRYCVTPRVAAYSALGFVALATAWGSIEARLIRLKEINIVSDKVPPSADGFKLLQISDVHIGPSLDDYMLKRIIRLAKASQPDLLVGTGDLIDGSGPREHRQAIALGALTAPKGNFAVLGNHEAYGGLEQSIRFLQEANMTLLRQCGVLIDDWLWLYGVDDPAIARRSHVPMEDIYAGMAEAPARQDAFKVLLKHQPMPDSRAKAFFDLQLSGHSHGGQIVPFNIVVFFAHRWHPGRLHLFAEGMKFYVSRGTGVWGPPLRFLAPPEMTLFVFRRPQSAEHSGANGQKKQH